MRGSLRHRGVRRLLVIAGSMALLAWVPGRPGFAREAAVIVNAKIRLADIDVDRLREIYEGTQKKLELKGQDRVFVLIVPPEKTGERDAVLKTVYRLDEQGFFQYWRLEGEERTRKPLELPPEEALATVGDNAKAIAIVGIRCPEAGAMPGQPLEIDGDEPCEAVVKLLEVSGHAVALAGAGCRSEGGATAGDRILQPGDLDRLAAATSRLKAGVKALKIDGREPCSKDYPLRSSVETRK